MVEKDGESWIGDGVGGQRVRSEGYVGSRRVTVELKCARRARRRERQRERLKARDSRGPIRLVMKALASDGVEGGQKVERKRAGESLFHLNPTSPVAR